MIAWDIGCIIALRLIKLIAQSIVIVLTQLDTNKAVVGAVREPPLRLISIGLSP
jgi:hypothetical protein